MTSKTRLLLHIKNGKKLHFFLESYRTWPNIIYQLFWDIFSACVMLKGCHVMSLVPPNPMSCQIILWKLLQRKEHTPLSMSLRKCALKSWEKIASFLCKIPLPKPSNAINEIHWCTKDSNRVSHVSHSCFLNDILNIQSDSNHADKLLF